MLIELPNLPYSKFFRLRSNFTKRKQEFCILTVCAAALGDNERDGMIERRFLATPHQRNATGKTFSRNALNLQAANGNQAEIAMRTASQAEAQCEKREEIEMGNKEKRGRRARQLLPCTI